MNFNVNWRCLGLHVKAIAFEGKLRKGGENFIDLGWTFALLKCLIASKLTAAQYLA